MAAAFVPQFRTHLPFGQHRLPLDTATTFELHPAVCPHSGRQYYEVTVHFGTLRNGQPYGWGDFTLEVSTLQKATALIQTLREHNLKWKTCVERVDVSLVDRRIDLVFTKAWAGECVNKRGEKTVIDWGDTFLLFQRALGLECSYYQTGIVDLDGGRKAIRLKFEDNRFVRDRILATFANNLSRLLQGWSIHRLLGDNPELRDDFPNPHEQDNGFHREKEKPLAFDGASKVTAKEGDSKPMSQPVEDPPFLDYTAPWFKVTEDAIVSQIRHTSQRDIWKEEDIPYFINNTEQAPQNRHR